MKNIFRVIVRLVQLLLFLPPVLVVFRYIRWYLKDAQEPEVE